MSLRAPKRHDGETQRKCVATGDICAPDELMRFALDPQGVVTPDFAARLPGRGAWTRAERTAVERAAANALFTRAFKKATRLPDGVSPQSFADAVEAGLQTRALDALGLARRAGAAVAGFEKVKAALESGKAGLLLCAKDASAASVEKLSRLVGRAPVVRIFSEDEQSAALGRAGVVYAAVYCGAEADRFLKAASRLSGFARGRDVEVEAFRRKSSLA